MKALIILSLLTAAISLVLSTWFDQEKKHKAAQICVFIFGFSLMLVTGTLLVLLACFISKL